MKRVELFTNRHGQQAVRNVVCFIVFNPKGWPVFQTCRRKMKDACMAMESVDDRGWDELTEEGYRVMKMFSSGYDRTDQSLLSIDQWVVEVGGFEPVDPEDVAA